MNTKKAKQRFTIAVDKEAINHFKKMGNDVDMPYHTLINMYLKMCASTKKKLTKYS